VLAAADFFTVEVWTAVGLVRYHVFFVIRLATREVQIAGIIPEPNAAWMKQMARNLSDGMSGLLNGCRYLIHDRASLFSQEFGMSLEVAGIESVCLPAHSPNLNAIAERFVRSIKESRSPDMVVRRSGFRSVLPLGNPDLSGSTGNLIVNGSFESPTAQDGSWVTISSGGSELLPWSIALSGVDVVSSGWYSALALEGSQVLDLDGTPGPGQITQSFATTPGVTYTLSFGYANKVLLQGLQWQDNTLQAMRAGAEAGDGGVSTVIGIGAAVVAPFLPPPVDLIVGLAALDASLYVHYRAQQEALQGYQTAWSSLLVCSKFGESISTNTAAFFTEIEQGTPPSPVRAKIIAVNDTGLWTLESPVSIGGSMRTDETTAAFLATASSASTVVELQNTGTETAVFEAFAFFQPSSTIAQSGTRGKILVTATKTLAPNEMGQLELVYWNGDSGAIPALGSPIEISVLGWNRTDVFFIGSGVSPINLIPTQKPLLRGRSGIVTDSAQDPTNTVVIASPLRCRVAPNPTSQSYDALIQVQNPFPVTLLATVIQPLSSGMTILSTDGNATDTGITWATMIPSNSWAFASFSFKLSTTPGAETNLPVATAGFSELTTTNSLQLPAVPPKFKGLLPVQFSGAVPAGTPGTNAAMLVAVTNLTTMDQSGALALPMTNAGLNLVTDLTQTFELTAAGSTNLTFSLPGDVAPGPYAVTGLLSINGGSGQVFAGIYTMPGPLVTLRVGPAPLWTTNGLSLALAGPVRSNYIIQASTNLANWTPIRYFSITNLPFYFNDVSATNSSARSYRALIPQ